MAAERIKAAAQFAIEDQVAGPSSEHALAVSAQDASGKVTVVVASAALLDGSAPHFARVIAEPTLALPSATHWRWCEAGNGESFVRTPDGGAFAVSGAMGGPLPAELKLALDHAARTGRLPTVVEVALRDEALSIGNGTQGNDGDQLLAQCRGNRRRVPPCVAVALDNGTGRQLFRSTRLASYGFSRAAIHARTCHLIDVEICSNDCRGCAFPARTRNGGRVGKTAALRVAHEAGTGHGRPGCRCRFRRRRPGNRDAHRPRKRRRAPSRRPKCRRRCAAFAGARGAGPRDAARRYAQVCHVRGRRLDLRSCEARLPRRPPSSSGACLPPDSPR